MYCLYTVYTIWYYIVYMYRVIWWMKLVVESFTHNNNTFQAQILRTFHRQDVAISGASGAFEVLVREHFQPIKIKPGQYGCFNTVNRYCFSVLMAYGQSLSVWFKCACVCFFDVSTCKCLILFDSVPGVRSKALCTSSGWQYGFVRMICWNQNKSPLKKRHVVVAGIHNINRLQLPSCCALKASLLHRTFNQVESKSVIVFVRFNVLKIFVVRIAGKCAVNSRFCRPCFGTWFMRRRSARLRDTLDHWSWAEIWVSKHVQDVLTSLSLWWIW